MHGTCAKTPATAVSGACPFGIGLMQDTHRSADANMLLPAHGPGNLGFDRPILHAMLAGILLPGQALPVMSED